MRHIGFILFCLLICLFLYSFTISIRNYVRFSFLSKQYITLEKEYESLEQQQFEFKQKLNLIHRDSFWELEAKRKLGYIRKDEVMFKFY